jgi:hypothetical protein
VNASDQNARHAERQRGEDALQRASIGFVSFWNERDVLVFSVSTEAKARARQLLREAGVLALVSDEEV